ncbi:MAG: hypothetical protein Q9169_000514 [Polycauliona sp. 2 TL-2023]
MATKPSNHNLNVFRKPLALFSQTPMTGFYRDGYCRTGPEDGGVSFSSILSLVPTIPSSRSLHTSLLSLDNHAIAGLLSKEFLDFSAARGNNLRQVPGIQEGCKWCLCTARWKEAMDAAKGAEDPVVPKVFMHATDESALSNGVTMDLLKKYAAEPEAAGGGGSLEQKAPISPGTKGGIAKETH